MEFAFSNLAVTVTLVNVHQDIQVSFSRNPSWILFKNSIEKLIGKYCEYLTSLSFTHNTSYIEMEPLNVKPQVQKSHN